MTHGDRRQTDYGPRQHKVDPRGAAKRRLRAVGFGDIAELASGAKHQSRRYDVLNHTAGVGTRHRHEGADVVCGVGDEQRRRQRHDRKHDAIDDPRVASVVAREQRFDVLAQRDADHREVRTQREHGKQRQEVADGVGNGVGVVVDARTRLEVQRVEVGDVAKRENAGQRQQRVEHQDKRVIAGEEQMDARFVGDGRCDRRQRVVAHEGVDADAEQRRDAPGVESDRVDTAVTGQSVASDRDHCREGCNEVLHFSLGWSG